MGLLSRLTSRLWRDVNEMKLFSRVRILFERQRLPYGRNAKRLLQARDPARRRGDVAPQHATCRTGLARCGAVQPMAACNPPWKCARISRAARLPSCASMACMMRAVLGQRFGDPPLLEQRVVAVELHHLAQVGHDLRAPAVAGHLEQAACGTASLVAKKASRCRTCFSSRSCSARSEAISASSGLIGHLAGGVAFEQRQQVVDLRHVVARHLGHVGAAAHLHRHQAFDGQHLERFAQRRAADAVLGARASARRSSAGLELAREDLLAQAVGHLLVQRARRQHGGRRGGAWPRLRRGTAVGTEQRSCCAQAGT